MSPPGQSRCVSHAPRHLLRALCLAFACFAVHISYAQDIASLSNDEIKQRIGTIWDQQVREIATIDIRYVAFDTRSNFQPLSREEVNSIFAGVEFGDDPDQVFRTQVAPRLFKDQHDDSFVWLKPRRFVRDGENERTEDWVFKEWIHTPEVEVMATPQWHQVDVLPSGSSRFARVSFAQFRWLPEVMRAMWEHDPEREIGEQFASSIEILDRDGDFVTFRAFDASEIVVEFDVATRLARRVTVQPPEEGIRREWAQTGAIISPEGIVYPETVRVCRYSGETGLIDSFTQFVLLELHVNEPIPQETFLVSANAGDTLVDFRADRHEPDVRRLRQAVADVSSLQVSAQGAVSRKEIARPARNWNLLWLAIGNALLLLLVAIVIHRHRVSKG